MNKPTVRFCAKAFEVHPGDTINFQPGSEGHAVTGVKFIAGNKNVVISTDSDSRIVVDVMTPVHIIRPATMMIRLVEAEEFFGHKKGDVMPAFYLCPGVDNLALVGAIDTLSGFSYDTMAPGYTRANNQFEIVEVL